MEKITDHSLHNAIEKINEIVDKINEVERLLLQIVEHVYESHGEVID